MEPVDSGESNLRQSGFLIRNERIGGDWGWFASRVRNGILVHKKVVSQGVV